ncbi:MAG TPA: DUF2231 domain-containing protein, partial [bacterium]
MNLLGQFHPQIVHAPVALLVFSAFFAIVGRLFDREWVRRASVLLLVFGFLGAFAAVQSGQVAHRVPEHDQGVSEEAIDEHALLGRWTLWVAGAAVIAQLAASRFPGGAAGAVPALALVLQLAAGVLVGITGFHGGRLTYEYGANVRIGGVLVKNPGAGAHERGAEARAPGGETAEAGE